MVCRPSRIKEWFHFFVFDFNELARPFGGIFTVGGHRRYFLSDVSDDVVSQNRHVVDAPADFGRLRLSRDNGLNSRHLERSAISTLLIRP